MSRSCVAPITDESRAVYASEVDAFVHGEYRPAGSRQWPVITRHVTVLTPARYHLYVSWASTRSHHVAILRSLLGLDEVVSLSYVDSLRDGRGWAFRARTGRDPVNGFTLLRQAYEVTLRHFSGEVRVPLLWDRVGERVACDDAETIVGCLLAAGSASPTVALTAGAMIDSEVARLERAFTNELDDAAALRDPERRPRLRHALRELDRRFAAQGYVAGEILSDADVRLWVRLARLDAGANASGTIGPRLDLYGHLWRWATELLDLPAFRDNTDFDHFAAPFGSLSPWPTRP